MRGITRDSVVEMFERKAVYVFAGVTLIAVVIILLMPKMEIEFHATGNVDIGGISDLLRNPITKAFSTYLSFMVFLAVLATAGLVPNMLIKGRADFYLSKPMSRSSLLLNKLFGIWMVYGGLIVFCGIITYAVAVGVHGFFEWKVLYLFALNLVSFLVWLCITITTGIISGSGVISIMTAFLFWVAQVILRYHEQIKAFLESKPLGDIVDVLYYIVPKPGEIDGLANSLALGKPVASWMPLYSSLIFSAALICLAVVIFKRKDY